MIVGKGPDALFLYKFARSFPSQLLLHVHDQNLWRNYEIPIEYLDPC